VTPPGGSNGRTVVACVLCPCPHRLVLLKFV
jgi:hypothetical protein